MRKTMLCLIGLLALLVFTLGLLQFPEGAAFAGTSAEASSQNDGHSTLPTSGAPTPGISAVQRHPGSTSVTLADVQQYVRTQQFFGGPTVSGNLPTVGRILATTSQEVVVLTHGERTGLPDNAPVYYVELHGPFHLVNANAPRGTTLPDLHTGVEVFDAQTGNLIMWGGF